jgi:hypothetical protein
MTVEKGSLMRKLTRSGLLALLAIGLLSCESRTDRTDSGGVLLTVASVNGLPFGFSMNNTAEDTNADGIPDFVIVDTVTLRSVVLNPTAPTSDLMDVEMQSYQVVFRRLDGGTATPPPYVGGLFGILVPQGGTASIANMPLLGRDQLGSRPLRDLLFAFGGQEQGTGLRTIRLGMTVTFFGRTLTGDSVSTAPQDWSIEFTR